MTMIEARRLDAPDIKGVLVALTGMCGVFVVVPMILSVVARRRFGSPSPLAGLGPLRGWLDRAIAALGEPLDSGTLTDLVIRIGLVVGWAAVASVLFSVTAEVVSAIGVGRSRASTPARGWSRALARWIVGGVLALMPNVGQIGFVTAAPATADDTMGDPADVDVSSAPESAGTTTWTVAPGDSLYGMAAVIASAADRDLQGVVDEILALNTGRVMDDGRTFDDPSTILPGWQLTVPAHHRTTGPVPATAVVGSTYHEVEAGDTLSRIAATHLGDADRWIDVFTANEGRAMGDGRTFTDADLILPGWELVIPPAGTADTDAALEASDSMPVLSSPVDRTTPALVDPDRSRAEHLVVAPAPVERPVGEVPAPTPGTELASAPRRVIEAGVPAERSSGDEDDGVRAGTSQRAWVEMAGTAMLAAGVVAALAIRRRRRLRSVPAQMVLLRPERAVVDLERAVVAEAVASGATDQMVTVDLAVRAAMAVLGPIGGGIEWLAVAPDGTVTLRPDRPVSAPTGWVEAGGTWMTSGAPAVAGGDGVFPCPLLCQIGVTAAGDDVFVDLEHLGGLTVIGEDADRVIAGVGAALAVSPFADRCPMVHVGDDTFTLGTLGNVRTVGLSDLPLEWTAGTHPLPLGATSVAAARCAGEDSWEPLVVLSTREPIDVPMPGVGEVPPVAVSIGPIRLGGGAVLSSSGSGMWELTTGDAAEATVVVRPAMLDRGEVALIADLLDGPEAIDSDLEAPSHGSTHESPSDLGGQPIDRPPALVRLLGDVRVETSDGTEITFERTKSVELLAWLVTHRERPTRSRARAALWETDVRAATFSNVVSDARRTLARVAPLEGEQEWIARTLTEELATDPSLRSDADLLREARDRARGLAPVEAVAVLRPALTLVEGLPFTGCAYSWPDPEGITSELVLLATGAAAEMAGHCLDLGDLNGVVWATGQGLKVLPGHEELIALRLRARAATGDMAGVRQEWASYERVLADEWTGGEPAPELIDLRRELLSARRAG
jgi:hypothetical protein